MPKIRIRSLDTENNRRIKLIKTSNSIVDIREQDGAVIDTPEYVGICLSPESNQISCDGATSSIHFPQIQGLWWVEVNGEHFITATGGSIANEINDALGISLNAGFDGFFDIENKSSTEHYRFKFAPVDGPVPPMVTSPINNPTFMRYEDGSLTFCLAPVDGQEWCLAENKTPVELKNDFYGYQDTDLLCIAFRVTNLDTGFEITTETFEVPAQAYKDENLYSVPNAWALKLPNNISSTYYSLSRFLENLRRRLDDYIDGDLTDFYINQGTTVKQTYLGINQSAGLNYGVPNTVMLKEQDSSAGTILDNFGGAFTFTPSSYIDAQTKIYEHYKPILEAAGYTVTYYNQSGIAPFMPVWGFRLAKTTSSSINLVINNMSSGANVFWDCGWTDWDSNYGYFRDTDCVNPVVTEEQFKANYVLTLRPVDGSDFDPTSNYGPKKRSTRIELMTYAEAGIPLPTDGVDWVQMNNSGQKIVIDSCYYKEREPS